MTDQEKSFLTGFIGGVLVIGTILGLYVNSFAPEKTAENITAVVSVLALIVSSVAVFYVYRTYQSQREELETQKDEIEYNRMLDILYRQMVLSKDVLKGEFYNKLLEGYLYQDKVTSSLFVTNNSKSLKTYISNCAMQGVMFYKILNQLNKMPAAGNVTEILENNMGVEFAALFTKLKDLCNTPEFKNYEETVDGVLKYLCMPFKK